LTCYGRRQGSGGLRIHSTVSLLVSSQFFLTFKRECSNYEPGDEVSSPLSTFSRYRFEQASLDILVWLLEGTVP